MSVEVNGENSLKTRKQIRQIFLYYQILEAHLSLICRANSLILGTSLAENILHMFTKFHNDIYKQTKENP